MITLEQLNTLNCKLQELKIMTQDYSYGYRVQWGDQKVKLVRYVKRPYQFPTILNVTGFLKIEEILKRIDTWVIHSQGGCIL